MQPFLKYESSQLAERAVIASTHSLVGLEQWSQNDRLLECTLCGGDNTPGPAQYT